MVVCVFVGLMIELFYMHAEDGKRGDADSRGIGEVYKRQLMRARYY